MALKAGYKGIKKIGTGLKLTTEGTLSLNGSGPSGSVNLDDLGDVAITEPANGNILVYDSTDEEWKNAAPTSSADKADINAIGTNETGDTSSKAYAVGEHFYKNGKFCTCTQAIVQGATFTLNTNYVEGTIADYTTDLVTTISYQFEQSETAVSAGKFIVIAPQSVLKDLTADYKIAWETILPSGTTEKDIIPINLIAANAGAWNYFSNTFNVGSFVNNSNYSVGMLKVQNNINRYPTIRLTYLNKKIVKKQFV